MGTRSRIARWGTSLAVRIPDPIAEQVTPGNLHPEASCGPAQGHERW